MYENIFVSFKISIKYILFLWERWRTGFIGQKYITKCLLLVICIVIWNNLWATEFKIVRKDFWSCSCCFHSQSWHTKTFVPCWILTLVDRNITRENQRTNLRKVFSIWMNLCDYFKNSQSICTSFVYVYFCGYQKEIIPLQALNAWNYLRETINGFLMTRHLLYSRSQKRV